MDGRYSIVQYVSEQEKHKCGYCKQLSSSTVHGMWAHSLTVQDYQDLIDRGWRRSGKYCYKPIMDITCCPMYTIRCEALRLKLSKSQKKILKRVNKFLTDGGKDRNDNTDSENSFDSKNEAQSAMELLPTSSQKPMEIDTSKIIHLVGKNSSETTAEKEVRLQPKIPSSSAQVLSKRTETKNKLNKSQSLICDEPNKKIVENAAMAQGEGMDLSKPPCRKAKLMRLERKRQKLAAAGKEINLVKNTQPSDGKSLEQFLSEVPTTAHHKLRISLVRTTPKSEEWKRTCKMSHDVYVKYQMAIHGSTRDQCSEKQFTRFLVESPLQLEVKRMDPKEPTFEISAQLYAKYQMAVHKDPPHECTPENYSEFLVATPLQALCTQDGPEQGYGSFHQQYWLDDSLIAVGVIDILPKCVSSVYFFYDPDYSNLSLGTYGSLRELNFTRELHKITPELEYYYMGYYIHSCPKMRYKASLTPSYLLCPETYSWFPIEQCLAKINIDAYARFNDDAEVKDPQACTSEDVKRVPILYNFKVYEYRSYQNRFGHESDSELLDYGNLVGKKCVSRMIFVKD